MEGTLVLHEMKTTGEQTMNIRWLSAAAATVIFATVPGLAANPITGAIGETKPIFDMRLRAENVDQDGIVNDAHAPGSKPARRGTRRC